MAQHPLTDRDLAAARAKINQLADSHATPENFRFILEWQRSVLSLLADLPAVGLSVYFSPGEECLKAIVDQIRQAKQQLKVCVFTISDDRIAKELLMAHHRGVDLRVITDNDKSLDEGSDIGELAAAGISVRMDTTSNHMHHKFLIADQRSILTGSYNWTRSAARFNHENLVLSNDLKAVQLFSRQFEWLWEQMAVYK